MNYNNELKMKLREIKTRIDAVNHEIKAKMKNKECIEDAIRRRNNLSVDLKTVKSRIDNLGNDAYMPTTYHIGE